MLDEKTVKQSILIYLAELEQFETLIVIYYNSMFLLNN
jgi:hypothetical protein